MKGGEIIKKHHHVVWESEFKHTMTCFGCMMIINSPALMIIILCAICFSVVGCSPGTSSGGSSFADDSVIVSWDHPILNDDGTNLDFDTVSGYNIYWSFIPGACNSPDEIFFVTAEHGSVKIIDLLPGTHYFQVTTVLHDGTESACSTEVFRSIGEG